MRLGDVPVGTTVHLCTMFYIGKALVLEQGEYFTTCDMSHGTTAGDMEYLRRGEVPPEKGIQIRQLDDNLEVSIVE